MYIHMHVHTYTLYYLSSAIILYDVHMHIPFYYILDPFLPRICELATSSSDRQTKVN